MLRYYQPTLTTKAVQGAKALSTQWGQTSPTRRHLSMFSPRKTFYFDIDQKKKKNRIVNKNSMQQEQFIGETAMLAATFQNKYIRMPGPLRRMVFPLL